MLMLIEDLKAMVIMFAMLAVGCGTADGVDPADAGDECAADTYTETVTVPDGTDPDTAVDTETATTETPPPCWAAGTDGKGHWCAPSLDACATAGGAVTAHSCGGAGVCCYLPDAQYLGAPGKCYGYLDPRGLCWLYPQVPGPDTGTTFPRILSQDHAAWCADTQQLGHDDWREATLDEIRPFIVGCPASEVGGACVITEGMAWNWALVAPDGPCAGCEGTFGAAGRAMPTFMDANFDIITSTTVYFQNGVLAHIYVSPLSGRIGVAPSGQEINVPVTPRCVRVPVSGEEG